MAIGTPANGRSSPLETASAAASAPSGSVNVNALISPSTSSIRGQRLLDELARADLAGSDELGELGYRTEQQIAHGDVTSLTGTGAFSRIAATRRASSAKPTRSSTSWPSAR